jgi:hypothetical protein
MPAEYGEAAPIEDDGIGAEGVPSDSSATEMTLAVDAESPEMPAEGFAASSAQRLNADTKQMAHAAVANFFVVNLIVASRTALRDHQESERRVNSTQIESTKQPIVRTLAGSALRSNPSHGLTEQEC